MWKTSRLDDVCQIQSGNSIAAKKKTELFTNVVGTPYVATKDVGFDGNIDYENGIYIPQEHVSSFKISPAGSTLVCAEGGSAGRKIAFSTNDCCYVNKLFSITPSESLEAKYIYYYALSGEFQSQFKAALHGLIGGVSLKKIKEFTISIPPLAEQQRIVATLDVAFAEIEKLVIAQSSKLRETDTLIASALEKMLTQHGEAENPVELQSLCESNRGITYGVIKLGEDVENGIPCLRTSNVRKRKIVTKGMKRIAGELSREYERTILSGGEVLVNVRGTLGGVSVVPVDMAGWNISREVAMVPIDTYKASADYISLWISSPTSEKWLHGNTKGAAYQGINLSDLRKLPVALPAREVQDELVLQFKKLLRQIDTVKEKIETAVNETATLKSAILAQELQPPQSEAA
jgi:type I restriction enzyme, S subunit